MHGLVAVAAGVEVCACGHRDRTILVHLRDLALADIAAYQLAA